MSITWRLLDTGRRTCSKNLALAETIITAGCSDSIPGVLHFFQYTSPCVLVGLYQDTGNEVRIDYCREQEIEVGTRLTGGEAFYCDTSALGWEIAVKRDNQPLSNQVDYIEQKIGAAITLGLNKLGLALRCHSNRIVSDGRELGWIGMTAYRDVIFFQGCIYTNGFNPDIVLRALRYPSEKLQNKQVELFARKYTCLKELVERKFTIDELKQSLSAAVTEVFAVGLLPCTPIETQKMICNTAYAACSLNSGLYSHSRLEKINNNLKYTFKETCKIEISLTADDDFKQITAVSIRGDFFAIPFSVVRELETILLGPVDQLVVKRKIREFFNGSSIYIKGAKAEDFCHAVEAALDKISLINLGICSAAEVNELTVIGDVLAKRTGLDSVGIPLLLPYCAKETGCKFRYSEGCVRCGRCDIGQAFTLADNFGLEPITIQNFEMLEEQLARLKEAGYPFFIGTCCELFSVKHRSDFERIGLPGILINVDNSTCYELGKEQDAYTGKFENQTALKIKLLEKIIGKFIRSGNKEAIRI